MSCHHYADAVDGACPVVCATPAPRPAGPPTRDPTYWQPAPTHRPTPRPTPSPTRRQLSASACDERTSATARLGLAAVGCVRSLVPAGAMAACVACRVESSGGVLGETHARVGPSTGDTGLDAALGTVGTGLSAGECILTCARAAGRLASLVLFPYIRLAVAALVL